MEQLQIDMKKTGVKIKMLCKERNITVRDIQNNLCIGAFQSVYDWFSGKTLPSVDNLFRLSKLLNVHMEDMIEVVSQPIVDIQLWGRQRHEKHMLVYYEKILKCV